MTKPKKHATKRAASRDERPMTPREKELHDILNPKHAPKSETISLAERRAAHEADLIAKSNSPEDKNYRPTITTHIGRDPNADLSMFEDARVSSAAARVRTSAAGASARSQSERAARQGASRHGRGGAASVGAHTIAGAKAHASSAALTDTAHATGDASAS